MASRMLAAGPAAETTRHVATGDIGYGFGPYAYAHNAQQPPARPRGPQKLSRARPPPTTAVSEAAMSPPVAGSGGGAQLRRGNTWRMPSTNAVPAAALVDPKNEGRASTEETAVERDPEWDAIPDDVITVFSGRGWVNVLTLVTILVAILVLFAGYPIITRFVNPPPDLSRFEARPARPLPSPTLTTTTTTTTTDDSTPTTPTDPIDDGTDTGTGDDGTTGDTDDGTTDDSGFLIKLAFA